MIEGRCPTVFEPMHAADGLLSRVKPFAHGLSGADIVTIAEACSEFGSGQVELTSRGNLQVRGLSAASAPRFASAMVDAGLASADAASERRRNIVLSSSPDGFSRAMAMGLEGLLDSDTELGGLPAKFTFAVGDNERGGIADIQVCRSAGRIVVTAGGGKLGVYSDDPLSVVQSLAHAFIELADMLIPAPRRMRSLIAACGEQSLYDVAGLAAAAIPAAPNAPTPRPFVGSLDSDSYGIGVAFGSISAAQMKLVATLAQTFSLRPLIRPSIHRSFTLHGVRAHGHTDLSHAAAAAGFLIHAADPLLRIEACVGSAGCSHGRADARAAARELAAAWRRPGILHVSGCPKGCAHSQKAELLLVAADSPGRWFAQSGCAPAEMTQNQSAPIADIKEKLSAATTSDRSYRCDYVRDGALIYGESFATIRRESNLTAFTMAQARVVVRMIHACGMTDLAKDVQFSRDFYIAGREALLSGMPILCDAEMVAHGITRARLPADNAVLCTLRDPQVAQLAQRLGNTRSAAAVELWGEQLAGAVVVIGNAPTALYHLMELIEAGAGLPAAIIGVPVGFVGAAESKAALASWGRVPFVTVHGRRGGSAIAAAAVNALAQEQE